MHVIQIPNNPNFSPWNLLIKGGRRTFDQTWTYSAKSHNTFTADAPRKILKLKTNLPFDKVFSNYTTNKPQFQPELN